MSINMEKNAGCLKCKHSHDYGANDIKIIQCNCRTKERYDPFTGETNIIAGKCDIENADGYCPDFTSKELVPTGAEKPSIGQLIAKMFSRN